MTSLPSLQIWSHGTMTCRITPATVPAPYSVVILDAQAPILERTFADHNAALVHAIESLASLMQPSAVT